MNRKTSIVMGLLLMGLIVFAEENCYGQSDYHNPDQVTTWSKNFAQGNSDLVKLVDLAVSPGDRPVHLLEIGKGKEQKPAVLVVANMNGLRPLTTEGAMRLCEMLVDQPAYLEKNSYYVLPLGNPDAASRYFADVKMHNPGNDQAANNDQDDNTDEDGFDDLNGDGYITQMRVKHPEGNMVPVANETRLMRKADKQDGESGIYKIYQEGLDNDRDGQYNEDGPGGTNVNLNFPHLFKSFDPGTGLYPGSSPEARGLIEYVYKHPEIAMAFAFGETNFCLQPPQGGRKGDADLSRIKIPDAYVDMLNAEKGKRYTIQEVIELVEPVVPAGVEVTESLIAGFLGLGAAVNPLPADLEFYNKLSKDYKTYLEEKEVKAERLDPAKAKDGSFELWAYYHLGIPVFSMDLFAVNKPEKKKTEEGSGISIESLEEMSTEEFLALGEEKIALFLKESGAPEKFSAKKVMKMMESGQGNPKMMAGLMKQLPKKKEDSKEADPKDAALLAYSDDILGGKGFIPWVKYEHPTLGEVEIGGFLPYMASTPPYYMVDSILELQLPWVFKLAEKLPDLEITDTKVSAMGSGIYRLEVWTGNQSYLPFPSAMGKRNKQPAPAILEIHGNELDFLEGYSRKAIQEVAGMSKVKNSWLIKADKANKIEIRLSSKAAGSDVTTVKLGD